MGNEFSELDFGVGARVIRGPNWKWADQDGGEGYLGTVRSYEGSNEVTVLWDVGTLGNYQFKGDYHDLRIYDLVGCKVRHPDTRCGGCGESPISGIVWRCCICEGCKLCSICYHSDVHDLDHRFTIFPGKVEDGERGTLVPARKDSRRLALKGILPGAVVQRGLDWQMGTQDGPDGRGLVLSFCEQAGRFSRDGVRVQWNSEKEGQYRVGAEGKMDLKLVDLDNEIFYIYLDHLQLLDASLRELDPRKRRQGVKGPGGRVPAIRHRVAAGSYVRVMEDGDRVRQMQVGHGEWAADMVFALGCVGKVLEVMPVDVRVNFGEKTWILNPEILTPVTRPSNTIFMGDFVKVASELDRVRQLQVDHGEWFERMERILGCIGRVISMRSENRVTIVIRGAKFNMNAATLSLVEPEAHMMIRGDLVRVLGDIETVKTLQQGHGGWQDCMLRCVNQTGRIVNLLDNDDVRLHVNGLFVTFNPLVLEKLESGQAHATEVEVEEDEGAAAGFHVEAGLGGLDYLHDFMFSRGLSSGLGDMQSMDLIASALSANQDEAASNNSAKQDKGPVVYINDISDRDNVSGAADEVAKLQSKLQLMEEQALCKACKRIPAEIVFQCGHSVCDACARTSLCPVCRKDIVRRIKLYA